MSNWVITSAGGENEKICNQELICEFNAWYKGSYFAVDNKIIHIIYRKVAVSTPILAVLLWFAEEWKTV